MLYKMSNINLCDCKEEWKEIKYKNYSKYISSKGRIVSDSKYPPIFLSNKNKGNNYVRMCKNYIHRLVYKYFIGELIKGLEIDHINTIKNHNCICNLRICCHKENMNNKLTLKKISENKKGQIPWNKGKKDIYSEETLKKISKTGKGRIPWNKGKKNIYSEKTKKNMSNGMKNVKKDKKCYFCNSKYMNINNFNNHHSEGKCLYK